MLQQVRSNIRLVEKVGVKKKSEAAAARTPEEPEEIRPGESAWSSRIAPPANRSSWYLLAPHALVQIFPSDRPRGARPTPRRSRTSS